MKRILFALSILTLALVYAPRAATAADVSIDFFYDNLGDDGSWIEVGDYGYCWQPNVASTNANWRPYADGYWAYTDVGWTWVSNENFGWATYHYGRWADLSDQGWVWVPGTEWGPAWVSWRTGGDYVGWAPLPPRSESGGEAVYEGRSISGRVDIDYDIGPSYYNFIEARYIGEPVLRERIFAPSQNVTYINRTVNVTNITYSNSVVYNYGPDYNRLSSSSVRPIRRMKIERETNGDFHYGRSGGFTRVQGEQLIVSAPSRVQRAPQNSAPKTVKTKIAKPNFERGWRGISDPRAKAEMQQKFKTEDTKSVPQGSAAPIATATPAAGTTPPAATATPAVGTTPPVTTATPAATVTPAPQASASPTAADRNKRGRGNATPGATTTPSASTAPTATPNESKDGKSRRVPSELTRPTATPVGESTPAASATPAKPTKDRGEKERRSMQTMPPPVTQPNATTESSSAGGAEKAERKSGNPNSPEGIGSRGSNRVKPTATTAPVQSPEGAASSAVPEHQPKKEKVQQQLTPQPNPNANPSAGREGQPRGEKGKKEKKPEASPAPEQ